LHAQTYYRTMIAHQNPVNLTYITGFLSRRRKYLCVYCLCTIPTYSYQMCIVGTFHTSAPTDRFTSGVTYFSRWKGVKMYKSHFVSTR